jgi:hypothetical protein
MNARMGDKLDNFRPLGVARLRNPTCVTPGAGHAAAPARIWCKDAVMS